MSEPNQLPSRRRARLRVGTALVVAACVASALIGVVVARPAAAAVLTPTLTGTSFTHVYDGDGDGELDPVTEADPLQRWQGFMLGVDFTLEAPLAVGDTFAVDLPEEIRGAVNPAFDLTDSSGATIGTCSVTAGEFACELTEAVVETWESTDPFHLFFRADAAQATTETTLPFSVVGGGTFDLPGPPGGVGVGNGTRFPDEPRKGGWVDTGRPGQIQWVVYMPQVDADSISFTDTLGAGEGQDLVADSIQVWRTDEWQADDIYANAVRFPDAELDVDVADDLQSFDLEFPTVPGAVAYWVRYRTTVPADVEFGDEFTNAVSGEQVTADRSVVYNSTAGGTGGGTATTTTTTSTTAAPTTTTTAPATTSTIDQDSTTSTSSPTVSTDQDRVERDLGTSDRGVATGELARTGSELWLLSMVGVALVAAGLALVDLRRRHARR